MPKPVKEIPMYDQSKLSEMIRFARADAGSIVIDVLWRARHPQGSVLERDLTKMVPPFVDSAWIAGAYSPPEQHSAEGVAAMKVSNDLIVELKAANDIVIGTPMFNFSIPAVLKAYIDQIVRVGVTVSPTNVGLLTGKRAIVILASGGDFSPGSPVEKYNQASSYLRQVLAWIGIKDVEIILAGRARAGANDETAVEQFGDTVTSAAMLASPVAL
jgi:FMN-dependent NADH-azoreductase